MYPRGLGAKYWDHIPHDLDVLITHGPPFGTLDQVAPGGEHLGCAELLESVEQKSPGCISSAIFTVAQEPLRREPLAS
jgi:Icc-related predicted phosphoesterase